MSMPAELLTTALGSAAVATLLPAFPCAEDAALLSVPPMDGMGGDADESDPPFAPHSYDSLEASALELSLLPERALNESFLHERDVHIHVSSWPSPDCDQNAFIALRREVLSSQDRSLPAEVAPGSDLPNAEGVTEPAIETALARVVHIRLAGVTAPREGCFASACIHPAPDPPPAEDVLPARRLALCCRAPQAKAAEQWLCPVRAEQCGDGLPSAPSIVAPLESPPAEAASFATEASACSALLAAEAGEPSPDRFPFGDEMALHEDCIPSWCVDIPLAYSSAGDPCHERSRSPSTAPAPPVCVAGATSCVFSDLHGWMSVLRKRSLSDCAALASGCLLQPTSDQDFPQARPRAFGGGSSRPHRKRARAMSAPITPAGSGGLTGADRLPTAPETEQCVPPCARPNAPPAVHRKRVPATKMPPAKVDPHTGPSPHRTAPSNPRRSGDFAMRPENRGSAAALRGNDRWTELEDGILSRLKLAGDTHARAAGKMGRSPKAVEHRWAVLTNRAKDEMRRQTEEQAREKPYSGARPHAPLGSSALTSKAGARPMALASFGQAVAAHGRTSDAPAPLNADMPVPAPRKRKPLGRSRAARRRPVLRLVCPVPHSAAAAAESPQVIAQSDLFLVAAHLQLPTHILAESGAAAVGSAARPGMPAGSIQDVQTSGLQTQLPTSSPVECRYEMPCTAPGSAAVTRDSLIRALLSLDAQPSCRQAGARISRGNARSVLLQQPYLDVVRHLASLARAPSPPDAPPQQHASDDTVHSLSPDPSHTRTRLLWLGDSIVSDLMVTGALSWAHACARHDCTNLGSPGETIDGLLRRVANETAAEAATPSHGRSRLDLSVALATRAALDNATAAAAQPDAARARGAIDAEAPVVVVHSGNNNLEYETATAIAHKLDALVQLIHTRLPQARVLVLGLFASRRMKPGRRESIYKLNCHLQEMAERLRAAQAVECHAAGPPVDPGLEAGQAPYTPLRRAGGGSSGPGSVIYVDLAAALACRGFGAPDCLVPEEAMSDTIHLNALGCHALVLAVLERLGEAGACAPYGGAEPPLPEPPRLDETRNGALQMASVQRRRSQPAGS